MPNKCTRCGKIHADDSPSLVRGCDECGSKFFFYIRQEVLEKADRELKKLTPKEIDEIERDIRDIITAALTGGQMSTDSAQRSSESTRILLVGCLQDTPSEGSGACIARTDSFRMALERAGIPVRVASPAGGRKGIGELRRELASGDYTAAVLISPFPAETALLSRMDLPLWIDINGMHPAEVQLSSRDSDRSGELMLRMLALENLLLSHGDMYSTPSRRQQHAVLGELLVVRGPGMLVGNRDAVDALSDLPHAGGDPESPGCQKRPGRSAYLGIG